MYIHFMHIALVALLIIIKVYAMIFNCAMGFAHEIMSYVCQLELLLYQQFYNYGIYVTYIHVYL